MRWTITNKNSLLYPQVEVINGYGIDDMERRVHCKLIEKGWNKDSVLIKNSNVIYNVNYKNGFINLSFLIEGENSEECQKKLNTIMKKCDFSPRHITVAKL